MAGDRSRNKPKDAAVAGDAKPDSLDRAIRGIRELQDAYFMERMIFIAGGFLSLLFAAAVAIFAIVAENFTPATMLPLLGSGGLFMTTGAGAMLYFGKSFDLLRELLLGADHG